MQTAKIIHVAFSTANTDTLDTVLIMDGKTAYVRTVKFTKSGKFKVYTKPLADGPRKGDTLIGLVRKSGADNNAVVTESEVSSFDAIKLLGLVDYLQGTPDLEFVSLWKDFWGASTEDASTPAPQVSEALTTVSAVVGFDDDNNPFSLPTDKAMTVDDVLKAVLDDKPLPPAVANARTPSAAVSVADFQAMKTEAMVQMAPLGTADATAKGTSKGWGEF